MQLIQHVGPFSANEYLEIKAGDNNNGGNYFAKIGIQIPYRQPIGIPETIVSEDGKTTTVLEDTWRPAHEQNTGDARIFKADIEIDGKPYTINRKSILEFDNLRKTSFKIQFLKDLPDETIIDCALKSQDE